MQRLFALVLCIRLLYALFVIFCDWLIPDNDTSSLLLPVPCDASAIPHVRPRIGYSLGQVIVWDAVYYEDIGRCGYQYEQYHAFFPLFPVLIARLSSALPFLQPQTAFVVCGVAVNTFASACSAVLLYRLSEHFLGDRRLAALAALFFALTPAAVFHTVAYTESTFTALTLLGLYLLYVKRVPLAAALSFAASCTLRSNGILSSGFLLHEALRQALLLWHRSKVRAIVRVLEAVLGTALTVAPYVAFQAFGAHRYCGAALLHPERPWCRGRVPNLYGFVQDHYWGVGFLKYYEIKQIPNFLLAAPVLWLSYTGIMEYAKRNWHHTLLGGLLPPAWTQRLFHGTPAKRSPPQHLGNTWKTADNGAVGYFADGVAVFVFYWAFMAVFATFIMHVQVATRFLSACPPIYWYTAHLWQTKRANWLWMYSFGYMALGALMHPNFYPWT